MSVTEQTNIEIYRHFIKEKFEEGLVCMSFIPFKEHVADVLTKVRNASNFYNLITKPRMEDIYSSA